jgi:hypothetical protein
MMHTGVSKKDLPQPEATVATIHLRVTAYYSFSKS